MKRGTKKSVVCLLSLVMLLTLLPMVAYANGADNYPYLTFQDSNDFTIVGPQISYEEIKAVGLDASFVKHDISDPWNITWTSSNPSVALVVPGIGATNYIVLLGTGEATVTASYTCADGTVITCPSNVVSERRTNPTNVVNSVSVKVYGDPAGSGINIDLPSLNVPLFTLKSVFGSSFDDADVLKMDPTALHALLYALELQLDDDNYVWGDPGWDWDWVPSHVTITSQGSYVVAIDGDTSGWPVGWKYKLNGVELSKASSIAKLTTSSSVDWAFRE